MVSLRTSKRVKWTWHDVIVKAMKNLGGFAHWSSIAAEARKIAGEFGKEPSRTFDALVRDALEDGCPECSDYKNRGEYFAMHGNGNWSFRNRELPKL